MKNQFVDWKKMVFLGKGGTGSLHRLKEEKTNQGVGKRWLHGSKGPDYDTESSQKIGLPENQLPCREGPSSRQGIRRRLSSQKKLSEKGNNE